MNRPSNQTEAIKFYTLVETCLQKIAKSYNIKNLERYYYLTDLQNNKLKKLGNDSIEFAFAQFAMHAQNATILSNIVKFEDNFDMFNKILCKFNPKKLLRKYNKEKLIKNLLGELHASNEKHKLIDRYAQSLLDGATYFSRFKSKEEVVNDLKSHYIGKDYKSLINYFLNKSIKRRIKGFSIALCCDFLKEFDSTFDLPKPDIHIRDVLSAYYLDERYKLANDKYAYKCIDDFLAVLNDINSKISKPITAYQLDRMIWLCCTGNFFLDIEKPKKDYIIKALGYVKN